MRPGKLLRKYGKSKERRIKLHVKVLFSKKYEIIFKHFLGSEKRVKKIPASLNASFKICKHILHFLQYLSF